MAENEAQADEGAGGGQSEAKEEEVKCPECEEGLPLWMGTFSDLVTLLLTFFVLLLSFAKTETAKYEAALGSIRNAFGGNVMQYGDVIQPGKSPDDAPTMIDSQEPVKPFPIDFLTTEGMLDKHEINRESDEELNEMKLLLQRYRLEEGVEIYEVPEGVKVRIKDKIYFKKGSVKIDSMNVEVFTKMIQLVRENNWTIFVEGHASKEESFSDGEVAPFDLSSQRATAVTRFLIEKGVKPEKITPVFYGDTRPIKNIGPGVLEQKYNRRVEFIIRKKDLHQKGRKVDAR